MNWPEAYAEPASTWGRTYVSDIVDLDAPTASTGRAAGRAGGGLSSKLLPELKQIASGLGIKGVSSMKKAQLVEVIRSAQAESPGQRSSASDAPATADGGLEVPADAASAPARSDRRRGRSPARSAESDTQGPGEQASAPEAASPTPAARRAAREAPDTVPESQSAAAEAPGISPEAQGAAPEQLEQSEQPDQPEQTPGSAQGAQSRFEDDGAGGNRRRRRRGRDRQGGQAQGQGSQNGQSQGAQGGQSSSQSGQGERNQGDRNQNDRTQGDRNQNDRNQNDRNQGGQSGYRDRRSSHDAEPEVHEDDVLVPVAGIVDILENYAFVRTSGYLPGPNDVYVSLSMVRRHGLRKGDAVTGAVRQAREGERKEKFNPLVRLESVNGGDVEAAKTRVDFSTLTPLYPDERLRMETEPANLIGRVIDIASPLGKGQRGLIVSPSKAGKTMVMQAIARAITANNPECHLMVVLVDERPEEVTDFQRFVKGEVVSSTFDRPPADHTIVAELAIERAKRLVELGHDVVVLLDGITRLGRAYNLAAPASGRILSGGVDSAALYPPKKFFGAARNIEDGGSLTIVATALVESGSKMDEVIFEEFKGTGNMEVRLRRELADKRLFPAIDAVQSGTRREELLMTKEELAIVWKLRRLLSQLDGQQALELLLDRLRKSRSNIEFLMQVQKTTPSPNGDS